MPDPANFNPPLSSAQPGLPDQKPEEMSAAELMKSAAADAVEIATEQLAGRKRRIIASIQIPRPLDNVWQVLTDYDRLDQFIPNLARSSRLPHPQGGIRLEQIGTQCFLNIQFCARVVLDMTEAFPSTLHFQMVEGDFKDFVGDWRLEPIQLSGREGTRLSYDLVIQPPRAMPIGLIERHFRHNLTQNLLAVRHRVTSLFPV